MTEYPHILAILREASKGKSPDQIYREWFEREPGLDPEPALLTYIASVYNQNAYGIADMRKVWAKWEVPV